MDLDTMAYRALVFLVPSNPAEVGRPARPVLDDCPTGNDPGGARRLNVLTPRSTPFPLDRYLGRHLN